MGWNWVRADSPGHRVAQAEIADRLLVRDAAKTLPPIEVTCPGCLPSRVSTPVMPGLRQEDRWGRCESRKFLQQSVPTCVMRAMKGWQVSSEARPLPSHLGCKQPRLFTPGCPTKVSAVQWVCRPCRARGRESGTRCLLLAPS